MRILIQRVSHANVSVNKKEVASINYGILVLLGIEDADTQEDIDWLTHKLVNLRIFDDEQGIMNKSIEDIKGEFIVISQFTLMANTKKGNRPSYIRASKVEYATTIYESFIKTLQLKTTNKVQTGIFGADMKVHLCNDGPVTIWIDSKNKE